MGADVAADRRGMKRGMSQSKRIVTISAVGLALLVLAGTLAPGLTQAHEPSGPGRPGLNPIREAQPSFSPSTDPHEDLIALGVLQQRGFALSMYASEQGPLYTIHDEDGRELATLLTASQVQQRFPELSLRAIDFRAPTQEAGPDQVMHADPLGDKH
jgi:hypothetical protein